MKQTTYTRLLETVLTSGRRTDEIVQMLELLRKMKVSYEAIEKAAISMVGHENIDEEDLA